MHAVWVLASSVWMTGCAPKSPAVDASGVEASPVSVSPPVAEKRPHTHTEHGVVRSDPYYWMRDRDDPALIPYLEAENAWTDARLAATKPLRDQLFEEMRGRIQEADVSAPVPHGPWEYYTRTEADTAYPIYCRRLRETGEEQVILDVNEMAEGAAYYSLGLRAVSPDHRWLAYAADTTGREVYTLRFRDLTTGEDLPDVVAGVNRTGAWATDGKTFLFGRSDEALRPHQIWRYSLGDAGETLVYEEADEKFRVRVRRTRSGEWLVLDTASSLTNELRMVPADRPGDPLKIFSPRWSGLTYEVAHRGDHWLVTTNLCDEGGTENGICSQNFQVMTASEESTDRTAWTPLIPHRQSVYVTGVAAFSDFFVVSEREDGLPHRTVHGSDDAFRIAQPEESYVLYGAENPEYETAAYRYGYASLVTPPSTVAYTPETGASEQIKQEPVPGYDTDRYVTERIEVIAEDGARIPVSIVRRADLPADQPHPTLLYGYGSYGYAIDPSFRSARISLLDRGVVFAIAHVRGGSERGRQWYEDGKFLNKKNTFTDFIAVARHLIEAGATTPDQLGIYGRSAGGLLIGAVVNMAPELFAVAIAGVPFVDVVTTMLDASIPLTANEWEEWGDPRDKVFFDYMHAYSPYDNVTAQDYPHLLITSGLNDPRVQYWEPTKWTARLRATVTSDNDLLLLTNMEAGHGGASGRYGRLRDEALLYGFLLDKLDRTALLPPGENDAP